MNMTVYALQNAKTPEEAADIITDFIDSEDFDPWALADEFDGNTYEELMTSVYMFWLETIRKEGIEAAIIEVEAHLANSEA